MSRGLFPRPLPPSEAGPSVVPYGEGGQDCQRRYLWTDAFAVLNLVTLARRCGGGRGEEEAGRRERLLEAAGALIETVHKVGRFFSWAWAGVTVGRRSGLGLGLGLLLGEGVWAVG